MMNRENVCELKQMGMTIGVHAKSQNILTTMDVWQAREDVINAKVELENAINESITLIYLSQCRSRTRFWGRT